MPASLKADSADHSFLIGQVVLNDILRWSSFQAVLFYINGVY